MLASGLQFFQSMKPRMKEWIALATMLGVVFSFSILSSAKSRLEGLVSPQDVVKMHEKRIVSPQEKRTVAAFERRVKQYVKLRDRVKTRLPKLSKDSTPEQIAAHEKAAVEALRVARAGAKPGDLFTKDIADYIRRTLKTEFKGTDEKEIRKVILDDETKPVPLRVNYPYPEENAFTEMPATLLLKLPQLPKQLKYRYVRRNLFLVDSHNNLIVDYMIDALP
jgi:Skp family chaperone for outer membrane proteins